MEVRRQRRAGDFVYPETLGAQRFTDVPAPTGFADGVQYPGLSPHLHESLIAIVLLDPVVIAVDHRLVLVQARFRYLLGECCHISPRLQGQ